jgi:cyanosortase A-associated protein
MNEQNVWHHNLMIVTTISIGLVAVYSFINQKVGNRSVSQFNFPTQIPLATPLATWEYMGNQDLKIIESKSEIDREKIQSASHYQYRENTNKLDIEMYYVIDTRGGVEKLLLKQSKIAPESLKKQEIKQQNNGYYSLFQDRDRTYLSSCLNPIGNSTVTEKQFSENLDRYPLNLELIGNWLLGKTSIRDRRCLWVTISTPNNSSSFLDSKDILEKVWQNWYRWWQPRFPEL